MDAEDHGRLRLTHGDLELAMAPEVGGAIASLSWRGIDILRRSPPALDDPLRAACFPLLPFANRIGRGRFRFEGREVQLAPDPDGDPHALHGQGWRGRWKTLDHTATLARLAYEHAAGSGGWPWRYQARQTVQLDGAGVRLTLELTNEDETPMPAGLGFHPYFPIAPWARLKAGVTGAWLMGADLLPTAHRQGPAFGDWQAGVRLPHPLHVDNCHTGWDGEARIDLPGASIVLRGSQALRWLHIYAPSGQAFFCAEPVSHRPDAFDAGDPRAEGLQILAPGHSRTVEMTLEVSV